MTFERRNPKNLSSPQAERHLLEHMAVAKLADLESGETVVCAQALPWRRIRRAHFRWVEAKHKRDDSLSASGARVDDADCYAIAQNGGAITERAHLRHTMRDENHGIAAFAPAAHDGEDTLRQVCRESGGDLVEDKQDRIGGQSTSQIDEAQNWIRNASHQRVRVEVLYSKVVKVALHFCK